MTQTLSSPAAVPARKRKPLSWRYRGEVAARALAALVAGYLVAYGFTAFMTVVLPFSRSNRVITASLLCFFVYGLCAMYAFAAKSAWRAWWVLLLCAGALYSVAWLFPESGARP